MTELDQTHSAGLGARGRGPLRGVFAAALTPLSDAGNRLDRPAVAGLVDFYHRAGVDGIFVGGTTGESLMLDAAEREQLAETLIAAAAGRVKVAVNVGAQTTALTVRLAAHAMRSGADAVAVAPPPFFAFDDAALLAHFRAAAGAADPLPFYLYEIRQRTGYAIPVQVVHALAQAEPRFVGMKVSDPTWDELETYLATDLDVMVGAEALAQRGIAAGAVGVVSGLAGALPRHVIAALTGGDSAESISLGDLRAGLEQFPLHASGKLALIGQGVEIEPWVRPPLRQLTEDERNSHRVWMSEHVLPLTTAAS